MRSLAFLRPQRRRIVFAIACSLCLAVSLAGSLSAIQPILQIFMTEQDGPRTAVFKIAAERAFGIGLQTFHADRHGRYKHADSRPGFVVRNIRNDSPILTVGVKEGDLLLPASDRPTDQRMFAEDLARGGGTMEIAVLRLQDEAPRVVSLPMPAGGLSNELVHSGLLFVGGLLPADTSPQATRQALTIVLSGVFLLVLFSNACRYTAEIMVLIASNRAVMDMRRHMYHTVVNLPITWFGQHLSETMSRVVTDFKDIERGYRTLFGKLITEPIKIVILIVAAIVTDWRITVFVLVAGPLGMLIVSKLGRKIRKANRKLLAGYAQMMGVLNATLAGMRMVRACNNQTLERRRMWQSERMLLKQLIKIGRFEALVGPLLEIMGVGLVLLGIIFMADYVFGGKLPAERFIALALFMVFIFDAIRKISEVYPRLARADGAAQRVFEMIDHPVEQRRDHGLPAIPAPRTTIELRDVTFSYPQAQRPSLIAVNLVIPVGQKLALVGPNGSGKTTCISLLERFLECTSGHILFDGQDIQRFSISSLRGHISLVTQDAVVFALSVRENILYGRPSATMDEVLAAARKAHAHEFIERLPKGYDTVLGEFGATLSGGERQRLALARAILRDAPIFIFDEATSQIDMDSEKKIQEATTAFMQGRTSIVIAHRINTITDADQIAVFDQGRLIDTGTHDLLLKRCDLYRTLYQAHTTAP